MITRGRTPMERRLDALEQQLRQTPSRLGRGGATFNHLTLEIIGGQTVSGIDCIKFAASLTLSASYDPDTDTTFPDGMGRAWLWTNGVRGGRVLVRHSFTPWARPVRVGEVVRCAGTTSLPYTAGSTTGSLNAYLFDYG